MDTTAKKALIVKHLSQNVDVLYVKNKNRIWKIVEHELQVIESFVGSSLHTNGELFVRSHLELP